MKHDPSPFDSVDPDEIDRQNLAELLRSAGEKDAALRVEMYRNAAPNWPPVVGELYMRKAHQAREDRLTRLVDAYLDRLETLRKERNNNSISLQFLKSASSFFGAANRENAEFAGADLKKDIRDIETTGLHNQFSILLLKWRLVGGILLPLMWDEIKNVARKAVSVSRLIGPK